MIFEQVESYGLAHYSYIVGDGGEAVIIDPRRDVGVYVERARQNDMQIVSVLETHRNEDVLVGSVELQRLTGAEIWRAESQLDYGYGEPVEEGDTWQVGQLKIEAISTPGHTPGAFSYLLFDAEGQPWIIFTGDALFAGDVGRVDFLGESKIPEMAGQLYDSVFDKILPLGDGVMVCPAHGSGSACGADIAERRITTVGLEKKVNPRLQHSDRASFVRDVGQVLKKPPYFTRMEEYNKEGAPPLSEIPPPRACSVAEFARELARDDTIVVDVRSELEFASSHVPGSLFLFKGGLEDFGGLFIPLDRKVLLVDSGGYPGDPVTRLYRMGFDDITGYLRGGTFEWQNAGQPVQSTDSVSVQDLCRRLDGAEPSHLLDIREEEELAEQGAIEGAHHIPIAEIRDRMNEIPTDDPLYIFCGSGRRSMVAASLLQKASFDNAAVVLGGIQGWSSAACPIVDAG